MSAYCIDICINDDDIFIHINANDIEIENATPNVTKWNFFKEFRSIFFLLEIGAMRALCERLNAVHHR